jgi:hypothetical protein
MADEIMIAVPIILGLIGVLVAIVDRGYLRYKEEQSQNPDLKFGGAYLLNFLITTGASSAIIITVIPGLLAGLADVNAGTTAATAILQLVLGYTLAYTMLSKLNTGTERKIELLQARSKLTKTELGSLDHTKDETKILGKPDK